MSFAHLLLSAGVLLGADSVRQAPVSAFELREIEITFYADRARRDPLGAADRSTLAALYLERSRETGSSGDLTRAERFARASLALRTAHNSQTFALLASILMAQHRFPEALRAAASADALAPGTVSHRALIAEVAMELGQYRRARAIFDSLRREPMTDASLLRLARWDELTGHPASAEREVTRVLGVVQRTPNARPQVLAWIRLRLAEMAMRDERLAEADAQLRAGLAVAPEDHRLLGVQARLFARRGRFMRAIASGERAIAVALDPTTLGVLSDAWAALGDSARASTYAQAMRTAALSQPGPPHRGWSLFLLDHDREVSEVLRRAQADLQVRRDVYGYDLVAWALYKSARYQQAWAAMQHATSLGTRDPLLARHAMAIRKALARTTATAGHSIRPAQKAQRTAGGRPLTTTATGG